MMDVDVPLRIDCSRRELLEEEAEEETKYRVGGAAFKRYQAASVGRRLLPDATGCAQKLLGRSFHVLGPASEPGASR